MGKAAGTAARATALRPEALSGRANSFDFGGAGGPARGEQRVCSVSQDGKDTRSARLAIPGIVGVALGIIIATIMIAHIAKVTAA